MDSILNSIKKLLGIEEEYTAFDTDIIIFINTAFVVLNQLGVGPEKFFSIKSSEETWNDFFGDEEHIEMVKTYVFMKTRMMFDPPTGSAMDSYNNLLSEMEFRLNVHVDPKE